ncbi:MAG: hypothetical protein Q7T25_09455 [Sideroxyarcus sp.]|nr:hypothetical protein [Sideroxyarcus sp.]
MSHTKNMRAIQQVIDDLGLTSCAMIGRSSKSIAINLASAKGSRKVYAPCTPSDWRNLQNLRRDMKKVAVEIGLICT